MTSHDITLFSYPCLKHILTHFEASFRFLLSRQLPSIRIAEKSSPLKIDLLHFGPLQFTINTTEFQLGVIRTCELPAELPVQYAVKNAHGGIHYDLDEYGVANREVEILPGDVVLDRNGARVEEPRFEDMEQKLRISMVRQGLERLENPQEDVLDALRYQGEPLEFRCYDYNTIEKLQIEILPHRFRMDRAKNLYSNYLQLTITPKGEKLQDKQLERVEYNSKLCLAAKYILSALFGQRSGKIIVKRFEFSGNILRVPIDLKLQVQELIVSRNPTDSIPIISKILHDFPLESIELQDPLHLQEQLQDPIVQNSKHLRIIPGPSLDLQWLEIFKELKNEKVYWQNGCFSLVESVGFIKDCVENPRKIGTFYEFGVRRAKFSKEIIEKLEDFPNAQHAVLESLDNAPTFPNIFTIPLTFEAELNIYGVESKIIEIPWIFRMEVVKRGTARIMDSNQFE